MLKKYLGIEYIGNMSWSRFFANSLVGFALNSGVVAYHHRYGPNNKLAVSLMAMVVSMGSNVLLNMYFDEDDDDSAPPYRFMENDPWR